MKFEDIMKLSSLLVNMEVPELRKTINEENIRWLRRNLGIKNSEHKDFDEAMYLLKKILHNE